MRAGKHYIALKRDLSNFDHVLEVVKADKVRAEIVENAYRDVVESGLCNYKNFTSFVLEKSLRRTPGNNTSFVGTLWVRIVWRWTELTDTLSWQKVRFYWKLVSLIKKLMAMLPESIKGSVNRWRLMSRFVA